MRMNIDRGMVVRTCAGRDKSYFQVVLSVEDGCVWLCDGKSHRLERPKKKNLIHIRRTKTFLEEDCLQSNMLIWAALASFRCKTERQKLSVKKGGEMSAKILKHADKN